MLQNMHSNIPYMFWLLGLSNVSLERLDAQNKIKQKPWKISLHVYEVSGGPTQ